MTAIDWWPFVAASLLLVVTPGAGTLSILSALSGGGLRAGYAAQAGLLAGDLILITLAGGGVAALLAAHPGWFELLRYAGAFYLAWLGARLLFHRDGGAAAMTAPVRHSAGACFRRSLLITLANPKAILFFMAFFPQFLEAGRAGPAGFAQLATVFCLINMLYLALLVWLAGHLRRRAFAPGARLQLNRLLGVCFLSLGIKYALR
ncbi:MULTISPECIES: LysE family translocator [Chromobacterium]|uniref:LysE family transporter n=2 Tax=Chromobacterium TaxID=535 RepID=A0ABS3GHZ9_9NEIS|nr:MULTISPECIES: LysE family transporter [Chromobacterium]AXT48720.1 lysine transporter LysE [Chromobacterium rhizoryzae]MBK0413112.1 LysE family transporter [Chromobacterium haemolyticum]MBO0414214.1 LysE family transporter [Chromobacterium haemolyticum]MBO0497474.1 LysE family transporter [Chromobacterium haemolyticum]